MLNAEKTINFKGSFKFNLRFLMGRCSRWRKGKVITLDFLEQKISLSDMFEVKLFNPFFQQKDWLRKFQLVEYGGRGKVQRKR